jgi:hypothetical protein
VALLGWGSWFALPVVALWLIGPSPAQSVNEYEIKAAFLYNFTRFVEWPSNSGGTFCIGIEGIDPFHGALENVVNGRSNGGKRIAVRRFKPGEEAGACEMVFVAGSDIRKARAELAAIHGVSVLTVGEAPGFCRHGGVVEFAVQDEKVRLTINLDAAQRAHLQISSKLLSLASVVRDSEQ